MPLIGLVVTDPLRIVGLAALLEGKAATTTLSAPRASDLAPLDLVIIDASATDHLLALIAAFRRMRPQIRLLVLGEDNDLEHTQSVIGTGAHGYLCHASTGADLRHAIDVVRDGSIWAPRRVLSRLLEASRLDLAAPQVRVPTFTPRQLQVLHALATGRSNREIAHSLRVDEGTIKSHMARLMRKAGVSNRTELSMAAIREGWIKP